MTGPEHYKRAEELVRGDDQDIAAAQVHATLALTAATVDVNCQIIVPAWREAVSK